LRSLTPTTPSVEALQAEYQRGYAAGERAGIQSAKAAYDGKISAHREVIRAALDDLGAPVSPAPSTAAPRSPGIIHRPQPYVSAPRPAAGLNGSLSKAERLVLTVLAQRQPNPVPVERVAAIAGYSAGTGHFNNVLGGLRSRGLIEPGHPLAPTTAGLEALGQFESLPVGPDLLRHWLGRLGKAERAILQAVADAGGETTKSDAAERAGYSEGTGHFNNSLGRLRSLGLLSGSGLLSLHEDLR
jgi:hypothetical protein